MPLCRNCEKMVSQLGNHLVGAIYQCSNGTGKNKTIETDPQVLKDCGKQYYTYYGKDK